MPGHGDLRPKREGPHARAQLSALPPQGASPSPSPSTAHRRPRDLPFWRLACAQEAASSAEEAPTTRLFGEEEAIKLGLEVLNALADLHGVLRIYHGDISAKNVMRSRQGRCVRACTSITQHIRARAHARAYMPFALTGRPYEQTAPHTTSPPVVVVVHNDKCNNSTARYVLIDFGSSSSFHAHITTPVSQVYAAPEKLDGEWERCDGRCDVFALAVLLSELLVGRPCRDTADLEWSAHAETPQRQRLRSWEDLLLSELVDWKAFFAGTLIADPLHRWDAAQAAAALRRRPSQRVKRERARARKQQQQKRQLEEEQQRVLDPYSFAV